MYRIIILSIFFSFNAHAKIDTSWSTFYTNSQRALSKTKANYKDGMKLLNLILEQSKVKAAMLNRQNQALLENSQDNSKVEADLFEYHSLISGLEYAQQEARKKEPCDRFQHEISYYVNPSNNQISPTSQLILDVVKKICP